MGALGGGLGAIWAPRVAQDGPRVEKPGLLTAPWVPKMDKFRYVVLFVLHYLAMRFRRRVGKASGLHF